jgi:hypothetical protein
MVLRPFSIDAQDIDNDPSIFTKGISLRITRKLAVCIIRIHNKLFRLIYLPLA